MECKLGAAGGAVKRGSRRSRVHTQPPRSLPVGFVVTTVGFVMPALYRPSGRARIVDTVDEECGPVMCTFGYGILFKRKFLFVVFVLGEGRPSVPQV